MVQKFQEDSEEGTFLAALKKAGRMLILDPRAKPLEGSQGLQTAFDPMFLSDTKFPELEYKGKDEAESDDSNEFNVRPHGGGGGPLPPLEEPASKEGDPIASIGLGK